MYVSQLNCVVVLSFILKPCQTLNLIQCLSIEIGIIQMEVPIFSKIPESSTTVSSPARRYYLPHFGNITTMFEISWCLFRSYPPPLCYPLYNSNTQNHNPLFTIHIDSWVYLTQLLNNWHLRQNRQSWNFHVMIEVGTKKKSNYSMIISIQNTCKSKLEGL